MKRIKEALGTIVDLVILGLALGLLLGIACIVAGYFILGFMWLTA